VIATCLIVAPWIYVGILLTEKNKSTDESRDLTCESVKLAECKSRESCRFEALKLMDTCGVFDTHNDLPWTYAKYQDPENPTISVPEPIGVDIDAPHMDLNSEKVLQGADKHTSIPLMREGRLSAQFWSIYTDCKTNFKDGVDWALEQIDITERMIQTYPEFVYVSNPYEARQAIKEGKIASTYGMEGGHMIGSRMSVLRQLFNLGIRYMTLTHNCDTPWAEQNGNDKIGNGLTEFGKDVVIEMQRLGMLVDLSHVSAATMRDALSVAKAPVIFSHSSIRAITNVNRNVPDDVLQMVKANGGVVCITFVPSFIQTGRPGRTNINDVVTHFNYIKALIGAEHACIGGDYNGVSSLPEGLGDVSTYPDLIAALILDGWTEYELRGILQENILRAWGEAYEYSLNEQQNGAKPDPQWLKIGEYDEDAGDLECKVLTPWKANN